MKIAKGSKVRRKNKARIGIMINGVFLYEGMEIEITGYDQNHIDSSEQITVRGIVKSFDSSSIGIQYHEHFLIGIRYIHANGVKRIVYDFDEVESGD